MTYYEQQCRDCKKLEVEPGIFLAYEELGAGDKYILCMHMGFPKEYYARKFADHGYHVFFIWNRGSGPSTDPGVDYGSEWGKVWAEDVIRFADKLGIDKFIYTGSSHGTGPGWTIAQTNPERLIAFIGLVSGVGTLEESTRSCFRLKVVANPQLDFFSDPNDDPALLRRRASVKEYNDEVRPHQIKGNYGHKYPGITTDEEFFEPFRKITTPTLLVGCVNDQIVPPERLLRAVKLMPNCKIIIYSQMSHHGPSTDYIEECLPEYLHFLKAVEENEGRIYNRIIEE